MDKKAREEKAKYDVIWREVPGYRDISPGKEFAKFFFDGFGDQIRAGQTLIDFGCGTARVAKDFISKGLNVTLVDISPYCLDEEIRNMLPLFSHQLKFFQACLWQLPEEVRSAYWIYCCDVMEHIPEDYVDTVLEQMASKMKFGGYFSICLVKDLAGRHIQKPLHLTVQSKDWWERKLLNHFQIMSADALPDDIYFNCRVLKKGQ